MWELLAKIFPPQLIVGTLIYALVCAIWLQPLIEGRMANITYIPQCEAGELPDVGAPARLSNPADALPDTPDAQTPATVLILRELRGVFSSDAAIYAPARYGSGEECACAVGTAFERSFWRSLAHVMTLRVYTPLVIEHFDIRVAQVRASGLCG